MSTSNQTQDNRVTLGGVPFQYFEDGLVDTEYKAKLIGGIREGKITATAVRKYLKDQSSGHEARGIRTMFGWLASMLDHGQDVGALAVEMMDVDRIDREVDGDQLDIEFVLPELREVQREAVRRRSRSINAADILGKSTPALGLVDGRLQEVDPQSLGGSAGVVKTRVRAGQTDVLESMAAEGDVKAQDLLHGSGWRDSIVRVGGVEMVRMSGQEFFTTHKRMMPNTWAQVCPRIYKSADKWHDPRYVSAASAGAFGFMMMNVDRQEKTQNDLIAGERAIIATMMVEHGMPLFFVDRELAQAAWMTDPPPRVDWSIMKLPHEAAAFVLPKGLIKTPHGFDLPFVMYGRVRGGDPVVVEFDGKRREIEVDRDAFLVSAQCTDVFIDCFRELVGPYEPAKEFEYKVGMVNWYAECGVDNGEDNSVELPTTASDIEFNTKLCNFVFNVLLLMQEEKEAVTVQRGQYRGRHKRDRQTELWTPNVVGHGYRIRRVGPGTPTGEHGTRRWHWRSGHWREQGYGRLICQACAVKDHGPAWHDRETGLCKHNDCLGVCDGARYLHESHYRRWIAPMLVGAKEPVT